MPPESPTALHASFRRLIRSAGLLEGSRTPCGVPVSPARAHALMHLLAEERCGISPRQAELQRALAIDKSNVSRLVKQMTDDDQVVETVCREDARARRITLTATGRRLARELDRKSLERFQELLDLLPVRERARIPAALDRLADAMETLGRKGSAR